MSEGVLPPQVAADPTREHVVSEWTVPLEQGSTEADVVGVLTWSPPLRCCARSWGCGRRCAAAAR